MIERYVITLRIMGENICPDDITRELNTLPETSHIKGDTYTAYTKKGKVRHKIRWKEDLWSKGFNLNNQNIEDSLEQVLQFTELNRESFIKYKEQGFRMDVFCGIWYENKSDQIRLPAELADKFAEVGIEISLDEYWITI